MILKGFIEEDFCNYKKPSMFLGTSQCSFKCDAECGKQVCQNSALATAPAKLFSNFALVERYLDNMITSAVVIGGLEPFDEFDELFIFIGVFRSYSDDDIVIYTGYTEEEIAKEVEWIKSHYNNIIIKFGRFVPDQKKHYDEVLGVYLASDNQYGKKIS